MTVESARIAGSEAASDAARDWQALRDAGDIQFAPLPPIKPPETPGWLKTLGEWLHEIFGPVGEALGMSWPTVKIVLIVLGILLALLVLWRLLSPLLQRMRQDRGSEAEPEWTPDRNAAQTLLEDADALAGQGRFEEAVHLLLMRSVDHIAVARPEWLIPANTAREIAAFPMLPERAREAFSIIAARVERSLFALRDLEESDWQAARAAYSDFALARLRR